MFGKIRRMGRIFKEDGRALIVAMDHCSFNGTNPGLECPGKTLEEIKEGGGDAVLVNFGVARKFERELSGLGYIARLDLPPTYMRKEHDSRLVFSAASALRLGADAVIINIGQGVGIEEKSFEGLAHTIEYCDTIGMPVCAETVPGGFDADSSFHALEHIAKGARIGNEIGCDFMKIRYVPGFEQIVKELEIYNLSTTSDDVKGIAFEKFLGKTFRGELGQFFTPRTVVDLWYLFLTHKRAS